jgi:hypothetical protein
MYIMNIKKWLATGLLLGLCFTPGMLTQANDQAVRATIITSPLPAETTSQPPTIKDRTRAILNAANGIVDGIKKGDLYIPKDTAIVLQLVDPVSSKKNHTGDPFKLKVTENLSVNNVIIIPKDTEVTGTVVKASGNGIFGRGGNLEVNIPSLQTINGVTVPLNGYCKGYGHDDNGAVAVAAAVTLIGGLFMRGENIYYNPGQTFRVTVQKDTDLQATPDTLATVMNPSNQIPKGTSLTVAVAK